MTPLAGRTVVAHVGARASSRLELAHAFLERQPRAQRILLVGATREAVDDLVRTHARKHRGTLGWHRVTLGQLASMLAAPQLAENAVAVATPRGHQAVAARATHEAFQRGSLPYFGPVADLPGFSRALAQTLTELRTNHIPASALTTLGTAGVDLAALLEEHTRQLQKHRLVDRAELLSLATQALSHTATTLARGWPLLLLDVPVRSAAEAAFAGALCNAAAEGVWTVPAGDEETLTHLRGLSLPVHTLAAPTGDDVSRVQAHLFSLEAPPRAEAGAGVDLSSAPGEARECVEVARRVLQEARAGVPLDAMAVVLRDTETYGPLMENALARAGIPAWFARGTRRPDPAGRAFLSILACAAERLSAVRFAEYLSLAQVPGVRADGSPPPGGDLWVGPDEETLGNTATVSARIQQAARGRKARTPDPRQMDLFGNPVGTTQAPDAAPTTAPPPVERGVLRAPWRWESLLVEAAVLDGLDRWQRRLQGLMNELDLRVVEAQRQEPDSARLGRMQRERADLVHLRAFALPIMEALAELVDPALPQGRLWGDWLERLSSLAPRVLRYPERVLAVLAELRPMAELGPVGIQEVRDVLAGPLGELDSDPPPLRYGCVFVGNPDQMRGRSFRVVFVPGLSERVFPRRVHEDPLLLDDARAALQRTVDHALVRRQDHRAATERLLLHLAVGAATERLRLSWSRVAAPDNRPRVPSFYALDVVRALTGSVPDHEALERAADEAGGSRLAWPAPRDAAQAIDELEHDLAVLAPLLRAPSANATGRARYLMELNPHLRRALRARWVRWEARWHDADGIHQVNDRNREALARHRLTARPYSPSGLQHYAACPYRFYLSAILRLEPRAQAQPLEQLDPLTRGAIFHDVQARFFRALESTGLLPLQPDALPRAQHILTQVFSTTTSEHRDTLAPAIARVWDDAMAQMLHDLRTWLSMVAADTAWVPWRFELGLGFGPNRDRDPRSSAAPVKVDHGFLLHGIIDLVERSADGASLRVTDHKTGGNRTQRGLVTGGGKHLQPSLYAMALQEVLATPVTEGRLFYCTSHGGFTQRTVPMVPLNRIHAVAALQLVDEAVEHGRLMPLPEDDRTCQWCDFKDVCGPHEFRRTQRKLRNTASDRLKQLRGLP